MWVMLSIFVFFPLTIALGYLLFWLALRRKSSIPAAEELPPKETDAAEKESEVEEKLATTPT